MILRGGYDAAVNLARAAALIAPPSSSKVIRSFAARRGVRARFQTWAAMNRDRTRPLLWMHAPSVGEGLQARIVLEMIRERRPDVQLVYTFYSPSAEEFAASLKVDYYDYLPFDTVGDARAAITAVAPTAFVYSKLDLWPNFTLVASLRGIRLGMISATVSPGSKRRGWMAREILREAYSRLDAVGAVSDDDAERISSIGARREVIFVTGDTRYDQVVERARGARGSKLVARLQSGRPTIVAGSTWPADEKELLPAFAKLREKHAGARLIIAPHEPSPKHLRAISRWSKKSKQKYVLLSELSDNPDVIIVDRLGVLGELYALADVAFVGGGFHDAGLHSVLEPAAFGAPVLFGPRFYNSRDAQSLIRARAASSVKNSEEIRASLDSLLANSDLRRSAGASARETVERGAGAGERSFELVDALLTR